MPSSCRISSLIPSGFVVDSETHIDDEIVLTVRAEAIFAPCPICAGGTGSRLGVRGPTG
jgi:hypothetical protein